MKQSQNIEFITNVTIKGIIPQNTSILSFISNRLSNISYKHHLKIKQLAYILNGRRSANPDRLGSNKNFKKIVESGSNKKTTQIIKLITKEPTWSIEKEQWVMNFHGRALKSSIKNMILVLADHQSREVMIQAKSNLDYFNIGIMCLLSPLVGLCIAAPSLDFKLASQ